MKAYFMAEKLKYHHTAMPVILILMPLFSAILPAILTPGYLAVASYNWWYMTLFPGMAALVCGMIAGKDRKMKNRAIWSLPCDMGRVWNAKVLLGVMISGVACICLLVVTLVLGKVMERCLHITFTIQPSLPMQILAVFVIWLTFLWQIPFCLSLTQVIGLFPMIIIQLGGQIVVAALVAVKPYFILFPGAIAARLMVPILGVLPNGLPAVEGQMTWSPELLDVRSLWIGIPAAVVWFLLFWWGSRKWFERQVGEK